MKADEWAESLVRPLVVGNGPIDRPVSDGYRGSVIRINNFELNDEAGYKVSHWATSGYRDIIDRPLPVAFIPWTRDCLPAKRVHEFEDRCARPIIFTTNNDHIFKHFPRASHNWKEWPSTGFCLLAWLWSKNIYPKIMGFDGMKTGHYRDKSHVHQHGKTSSTELEIIRMNQ